MGVHVHDKLLEFLLFFMVVVQSLDAVCIARDSGEVNDHHPSINNSWSDLEQWNSSVLSAFCPSAEGGTLRINCADDKGESIIATVQAKAYTASCSHANGLICSGNKQTNGHCPDFSVRYTCICPTTTTTNTLKTGSSLKPTTRHVVPTRGHVPDTGAIGTGSIVGIAVGVVVILSLVGGGVLIYCNISKKNRRNKVDDILNAK